MFLGLDSFSRGTEERWIPLDYLTGILAILTRKYALTFFQELDKMPDCPRTNHELQVLREIKDQKIFFIILVIYFFAMGTVTLCYE